MLALHLRVRAASSQASASQGQPFWLVAPALAHNLVSNAKLRGNGSYVAASQPAGLRKACTAMPSGVQML